MVDHSAHHNPATAFHLCPQLFRLLGQDCSFHWSSWLSCRVCGHLHRHPFPFPTSPSRRNDRSVWLLVRMFVRILLDYPPDAEWHFDKPKTAGVKFIAIHKMVAILPSSLLLGRNRFLLLPGLYLPDNWRSDYGICLPLGNSRPIGYLDFDRTGLNRSEGRSFIRKNPIPLLLAKHLHSFCMCDHPSAKG